MFDKLYIDIPFILCAYLYASIPFVAMTARLKGVDLRQVGSRSVSSSNLLQHAGLPYMVLGGAGDFSKGVIPAALTYVLHPSDWAVVLICAACVAGQCWPVFRNFYGGRGGASGLGAAITLFPVQLFIAIAPMLLVGIARSLMAFISGRGMRREERLKLKAKPTMLVPLTFLLAFLLLPILSALWHKPNYITFSFVAILVIILIRRLTADITGDFKRWTSTKQRISILLSRLFLDRSFRRGWL